MDDQFRQGEGEDNNGSEDSYETDASGSQQFNGVLAGVLESIVDTLDEWAHFVILVVLVAVTVLTSIHRLITASILLQVRWWHGRMRWRMNSLLRLFSHQHNQHLPQQQQQQQHDASNDSGTSTSHDTETASSEPPMPWILPEDYREYYTYSTEDISGMATPLSPRRHEPSQVFGELNQAAEAVSTEVRHEAISGDDYGWFQVEEYHIPLEVGKTVMTRRRAVRFLSKTHGAVLMVHGFAQNRFAWHIEGRSLANYVAEAGYDVFHIDLRGTRDSRKLGAKMPRSCYEYVEIDLCQAVRLATLVSGHEKLTVIGHSLGGALSCSVAAIMPEFIDGVVHIAGLYSFSHHAKWKPLLLIDRLTKPIQQFVPTSFWLPTREFGMLIRYIQMSPISWLMPWFIPTMPYVMGNIELTVLYRYLRTSFETTSFGILQNITGLAHGLGFVDDKGEDYLERFSKLKIPLLVICADHDDFVNINDSLACFHQSASTDKEHLVFISDMSHDSSPVFGHCDILIGRRAVHHVWAPLRMWLDRHRSQYLVDNSEGLPATTETEPWAQWVPARWLSKEVAVDERNMPAPRHHKRRYSLS